MNVAPALAALLTNHLELDDDIDPDDDDEEEDEDLDKDDDEDDSDFDDDEEPETWQVSPEGRRGCESPKRLLNLTFRPLTA